MCFFCIEGRNVQRKKSKKMRSSTESNLPSVTASNVQSHGTINHSSEHQSVSKTDKKHALSPTELKNGQKNASKKRNKTSVATACAAANSEYDATLKLEGQEHQTCKQENVGSLDSVHCAQCHSDHRSESGIQHVCFMVCDLILIEFHSFLISDIV